MEPGEASKLEWLITFDTSALFRPSTTWRRPQAPGLVEMQSVELPSGDNVGVIEPWSMPDPSQDATAEQLRRVRAAFRTGKHRAHEQSKAWGGYTVADSWG